MTSRLLRVDMSDGSRDFMAVATEPGLPMLDATGANYGILRRWLGALVAEPEMQSPELVGFYARDPQRGRLEDLTCQPATAKDLRGLLKPDLDAIEAGIRKAKPESANEKLLHRIIAKSFREQTADIDKSDFDCYFFKYRQSGSPWRLVWCWGYQRRDREPSRAVICSNLDCHQLFAHRPNTKRRCPACQTIAARKRRPLSPLWSLAAAALLLLLGVALVALLYPPQLVVEPAQWSGPPESRIQFRVVDRFWLLFNRDVTSQVTKFQSSTPGVVEIDGQGASARAKSPGRTRVTFRLGDRLAEADVVVSGGVVSGNEPPKVAGHGTLVVKPEQATMAVGEHLDLNVTSSSPDDVVAQSSDPAVVTVVGTRTLSARRAGQAEVTFTQLGQQQAVKVNVKPAEYRKIEIHPATINLLVGEVKGFDVVGLTPDGRSVSLAPDQLKWVRQPLDAEVTRSLYQVRGRTPTSAPQTLEVQFADLPPATAEVSVTPGLRGAEPEFGVYPQIRITRPVATVDVGAGFGGPLRLLPGQGLMVDKVPAGSLLELAGVAPGSAIGRIDGTDITGMGQGELVDWVGKHPINTHTVLGVTGPDGKLRDVPVGLDVVVLHQVEVLGIAPSNVAAAAFDAAVKIHVVEKAEYRIVDDAGKPLSEWSLQGPNADATIDVKQIPRAVGRSAYDLNVERRIAGDVKRYPFVISLSASQK